MRFENCSHSFWAKIVCQNYFLQQNVFQGSSYGFKPFNMVKFFSNQFDGSEF